MTMNTKLPETKKAFIVAILIMANLIFAEVNAVQASKDNPKINAEVRYKNCLLTVDTNAKKAFDDASQWAGLDGGLPARHCQAAALMALGQFKEAAIRLEQLAISKIASVFIQTDLLAQAAAAWGQVGNTKRADANLTAALKLLPNDGQLLISRAQVRALQEDYPGALYDLNKVIRQQPSNAEAYAYRASTYRLMENFDAAMQDANTSLRYDLNNISALLERGILKRLSKNDNGARQDWLRLIKIAPTSAEAESARKNIATMDIRNPAQ